MNERASGRAGAERASGASNTEQANERAKQVNERVDNGIAQYFRPDVMHIQTTVPILSLRFPTGSFYGILSTIAPWIIEQQSLRIHSFGSHFLPVSAPLHFFFLWAAAPEGTKGDKVL